MKKRNYLTMITSLIAFGFCFTLIACDNGENPSDSTSGNISNSDSSLSDESSSSEVLKYYNVVFNPNNGEDTYSYEVLENDKVLNSHLHKLQGHTFLGWYNNDQLFDISTSKITEDITLEAKWSANEYTINFVLSGGSFINRILMSEVISGLEAKGKQVYTNEKVPCGDGGIALGQIYLSSFQ